MTVKELIEVLEALPPEYEVWVERGGEHLPLERGDIQGSAHETIFDADGGEQEEAPAVIITTWS